MPIKRIFFRCCLFVNLFLKTDHFVPIILSAISMEWARCGSDIMIFALLFLVKFPCEWEVCVVNGATAATGVDDTRVKLCKLWLKHSSSWDDRDRSTTGPTDRKRCRGLWSADFWSWKNDVSLENLVLCKNEIPTFFQKLASKFFKSWKFHFVSKNNFKISSKASISSKSL